MKLRTRLEPFCVALLSALGSTQLVACGGNALTTGGDSGSSGLDSAGSSGVSGSGGGSFGFPLVTAGAQGIAGARGIAGASSGHFPCTNPVDLGNGFVQCDAFKHRQKQQTCPSQLPRPDKIVAFSMMGTCAYDAECKDKPHGWCSLGGQIDATGCAYGCVNDSECGAGQICECGDPIGRCVQAQCVSDADCASGFLCKAYDASGGCGQTTYTCQTAADTCGGDSDCVVGAAHYAHCRLDATRSGFQCNPQACAIGRPFLVDDTQRLAPSAARADWSELTLLPRGAARDELLSARLAQQWTRVALMEHASIAAFARFTLQLMSLGAPASLLEQATAAMVDETKHAKACFAVASRYAGTALGPGQLDIERSLHESSLQAIVLNAIREGCVGETVAAIEALEAAEHANDPALRALLLEIGADETRHAELAYRFVQWALTLGDPELERAVRAEFAALGAEAPSSVRALTTVDDALLSHGVLPDAMRGAIRQRVIAQVILPCSRTLFAPTTRAGADHDQLSAAKTLSSAS